MLPGRGRLRRRWPGQPEQRIRRCAPEQDVQKSPNFVGWLISWLSSGSTEGDRPFAPSPSHRPGRARDDVKAKARKDLLPFFGGTATSRRPNGFSQATLDEEGNWDNYSSLLLNPNPVPRSHAMKSFLACQASKIKGALSGLIGFAFAAHCVGWPTPRG